MKELVVGRSWRSHHCRGQVTRVGPIWAEGRADSEIGLPAGTPWEVERALQGHTSSRLFSSIRFTQWPHRLGRAL